MPLPTSGKRIYELDNIASSAMLPTALFVISQDNLTRSIGILEIIKYVTTIDGSIEPDKFYASSTIDKIVDDLIKRINTVSNNMSGFNQLLQQLSADLNGKINSINQDINLINNELSNINKVLEAHASEIEDLKIKDTQLQQQINELVDKDLLLDQDIENLYDEIERLDGADFDINNRIDGLIKYGTSIPTTTTCPVGHLYVQLF